MTKFYGKNKAEKVKARYMTAEVGDSTQKNFDYSFAVEAWDGECNFRVKLTDKANDLQTGSRVINTLDAKKPVADLTIDGLSHSIYSDGGGLEWEIKFDSKPTTNVFTFPFESKGLTFHYQPEMTPEELADNPGAYRPPHVVGSYAVRHNSRRGDRVFINGTDTIREQYQTGKAFHIYRPFIVEADHDSTFCEINIDTILCLLTLTVPQKTFDVGDYPMYIDPYFGDSTKGGTPASFGTEAQALAGASGDYQYTASAGDTVTAFWGWYSSSGSSSIAQGVYVLSGGVPTTRVGMATFAVVYNDPAEVQGTDTVGIGLTNGTTYVVAWGNEGASNVASFYDNLGGNLRSNSSNATLESAFGHNDWSGYDRSFWAEVTSYGAGAAEEEPTRRRRLLIGGN